MMPLLFRRALPHVIAVIVLCSLAVAYFRPQLDGRVVPQGDMIQYEGMTQEILRVEQATGKKPLWTDAMFGGMPTYQINTPDNGNYLRLIDRAARLGLDHPLGLFLPAMLSFYLLMLSLGVSAWPAAIGAFAFAFTTNSLTLYEAGHITKLRAIAWFPLIAAGMVLAYRGRAWWGASIFATGLGLDILANHVQLTYYLALTVPVYLAAQAVADARAGRLRHFARSTAALAIGGILAVGSSTASLWTTYEYAAETTRGRQVLSQHAGSNADGLAWDYAMQWSNGPIDLLALVVPGAAGGSSAERLDGHSAIEQDLRARGYQTPEPFRFPLYWGALPSTSGPAYLGASVLLLFVVGLFVTEGPVTWWLGLGTLLTLLLSLGRHLAGLNVLVFAYLPLYDSFRAPNSVLAVTAFFVPLLATIALDRIVRGEVRTADVTRALVAGMTIVGGLALALFLLGGTTFDFAHAQDAALRQVDPRALLADRQALLGRDALRSLSIVVAAGAAVWAFARGRVGRRQVVGAIVAVVLFDLWTVGRRYINDDSFVSAEQHASVVRPRAVDLQILKDADPNYRVLDATVPPFQSAQPSYFHLSVGGYHAAKLRRYQDLIDRHLARGNAAVLDMLNTRYVVAPGSDGAPAVQRRATALGNAWFVATTRLVDGPDEEIAALSAFDPARTAIVHREFVNEVTGVAPLATPATITLSAYRPDHLTYRSESSQEAIAVFSEIWYGPDKGWRATIDDQPATIIRANYALRALRVPAGTHRIAFMFEPASFLVGRRVSQVCSGLTLLGLLVLAGLQGVEALRSARR